MIGVLELLFTINPTSPAPPPQLVPLGLASYILPLCTNIIVTSLIVYRLWYASRASRAISDSPLYIPESVTRRAMMLSVESGALYLVFQLVFVVLFAIPHPAEAILAVMAVQIYVSNPPSDSEPISKPDSPGNRSDAHHHTRWSWYFFRIRLWSGPVHVHEVGCARWRTDWYHGDYLCRWTYRQNPPG